MSDAPVTDPDTNMEQKMTRAEWIAAAALALSAVQGAYIAGVEVQRLNEHDRRLAGLEETDRTTGQKIETLLMTTARIDANVADMHETVHPHHQD